METVLRKVQLKRKRLDDYVPIVGPAVVDALRRAAAPLRGLRLLHVNSTSVGGGVAELLTAVVPLQRDLGIDAEWRLLCPDDPFFVVTKALHNGMQGAGRPLATPEIDRYLAWNEHCSHMIAPEEYDVIVVHDPQPAGLRTMTGGGGARWIWRCHLDSSEPGPQVWGVLRPLVEAYDRVVFTLPQFVPPGLVRPAARSFIAPAIDPLSPKNQALSRSHVRQVVGEFGIDLGRPLLLQVSRFDPWKDPEGAIRAWRLARERVPGLQLALVGSMARDDPEGWEIYGRLSPAADAEDDLFLFTNLTGVQDHEVNCFQSLADVVLQKSLREGFGLVVSEALWKQSPVVGGRTGGITLQIRDGETGFLVDTVEEAAARTVQLIEDPALARRLGEAGHEHVRRQFLVTRLLGDWLAVLRDELAAGTGRPRAAAPATGEAAVEPR